MHSKVAAGGPGWAGQQLADQVVPHLHAEEQLGNKTDHATQGSSEGKESFKTSGYKNL